MRRERNYVRTLWLPIAATIGLFSQPASAQTSLSGALEDLQLHWTTENSPYILENKVVVPVGKTLVIDEGVQVFGQFAGVLQVEGSLQVNGKKANPVGFSGQPGSGGWPGIILTETAGPSRISGAFLIGSHAAGILSNANDFEIEDFIIFESSLINIISRAGQIKISRSYIVGGLIGIQLNEGASIDIKNSVIRDTSVGIYIYVNEDMGDSKIVHTTFDDIRNVGHFASSGAIIVDVIDETSFTSIVLKNSIVSNSDNGFVRMGSTTNQSLTTSVGYSNFWNVGKNMIGAIDSDDTLINVDPMYVGGDVANNLHLSKGSPCIDVAQPLSGISMDYDQSRRPQGFGPDMGAYEFNETPRCGDGHIDDGEQCDDGNVSNWDACTNTCKVPTCGDGFINDPTEECDDGNARSNDGCSAMCIREVTEQSADGGGCVIAAAPRPGAPGDSSFFAAILLALLYRRAKY